MPRHNNKTRVSILSNQLIYKPASQGAGHSTVTDFSG